MVVALWTLPHVRVLIKVLSDLLYLFRGVRLDGIRFLGLGGALVNSVFASSGLGSPKPQMYG
jgi:hypothetical protein